VRFPQPLPDKAIHRDHRFAKGMDAGLGSADSLIVDLMATGVDVATDNAIQQLVYSTTSTDSVTRRTIESSTRRGRDDPPLPDY
jgi:hypothetical protein